tara:strand:+ start:86 stop:550 length:465 start_codon:yes stop_codon:yes gene_type:complete
MVHNPVKDITDQTFGERVVLGYSHQDLNSKNYYWKVRCSCGREDVVKGSYLKTGKSNRCRECSGRENGRKGLITQSKGLPVYFIQCGDYVKIGCSTNPKRRLKEMMVNNPYECKLLKVDTENEEEYWHNKFISCKHRGEWYILKQVCEVVDIGA